MKNVMTVVVLMFVACLASSFVENKSFEQENAVQVSDLATDCLVKIVDLEGVTIKQKEYKSESKSEVVQFDQMANGNYFVHIVAEEFYTVKKLTVE